jgi:hypothetical protein
MGRTILAALFVIAGCAKPPATPLVATLTALPDAAIDVVIVNRGTATVEVATQALESAQLLFRVQQGGVDIASGPPPTPRLDTTTIAPGQRVTRKVRLDVFSPPLAPGEYSVTVRAAEMESNTVRVLVRPP